MNNHILKKISFVVLMSFSIQTVLPGVAYATGWPVVDPLNGGINTSTSVSSHITSSQQILKSLKDYGLDQIAYSVAQKLGAKMANKLVNKANGGASGDSGQKSFIENFAEYLSDSDMQQIDKFLTDLTISKNPHANALTQSIIKGTRSLSQGKSALESFNLDKVVGANWKDFSTDATAGGWDGILALSNAANTNIGVEIIGKKELAQAKDAARYAEQLKLTASGTKPQGKCSLKWEDYKAKTLAIKEGRDNVQFAQQAQQAGATNDDGTAITDAQIRQLKNDNISTATGLAENYGGCLQEAINNPVGLVTQGVGEATGYALKQTQQIQGWGQIIAGIFVSMFGSFVQSGLSSLSGDFNNSRNKSIGGPEQLLTKNGQQVPWTSAPTNIVNMPESFPESISLTETEIASLNEYLTILGGNSDQDSIIGQLAALDSCIPGPDYDYSNRLDSYITQKTSRLTRKQISGKNEKKQEARADAGADVENSVDEAKSKISLAMVDPRLNIPGAAVMKDEINKLGVYKQKYQEKKSALLDKQNGLNILYKIENELTTSVGNLSSYIPTIPANIPFSNHAYLQLTAPQVATLVTWAKKTKKLPTTVAEWNALTTVDDDGNFIDRDGAFAWAKSLNGMTNAEEAALLTGTVQQREQKKRDYVLATPRDLETKRSFIISTVWDMWSFPERYMTDDKAAQWNTVNPTTGTSPAQDFLDGNTTLNIKGKNEIRSEFNSMAEKIAIRRTIDNAKLDVSDLNSSLTRVKDMLHDCRLMTTSIKNFQPQPGASNHSLLKTYLLGIQNQFKIKEVRNSISGTSILSATNTLVPPGVTCDDDGTNCVDTSANGTGNNNNVYTSMDDIPAACSGGSDVEIISDETTNGIRTIKCGGDFNDDGDPQHTLTVTVQDSPTTNPTHFVMTVQTQPNLGDNYQYTVCLGSIQGTSQGKCVGIGIGTRSATSANYPLTILPPIRTTGIARENDLQLQPPRDIWGVIRQGEQGVLFCYFNRTLADYVNYPGAGIRGSREKQQILCSQAAKWENAELGDYIGYVFGEGITN